MSARVSRKSGSPSTCSRAVDHAGRRDEVLRPESCRPRCSAGRGRRSSGSARRNACRCARRRRSCSSTSPARARRSATSPRCGTASTGRSRAAARSAGSPATASASGRRRGCGRRPESADQRSPSMSALLIVVHAICASSSELALEHLRVVAPARQPLLRDVAGIDVLDAVAQRLDDRAGQRRGRELRRRQRSGSTRRRSARGTR